MNTKLTNLQSRVVDVTLSVDTAIYAANDVLAASQAVTVFAEDHGSGTDWLVIESLTVIDQDDQGVAFDLLISNEALTLAAENAACTITDADANKIYGVIEVATGDFVDLITAQVAMPQFNPIVVPTAGGVIYLAAITRGGTPTYTNGAIKLRIGYRVQNRGA